MSYGRYVLDGKVVEGHIDREHNQMSLFVDDGNNPNPPYQNWVSDFKKTGKWNPIL